MKRKFKIGAIMGIAAAFCVTGGITAFTANAAEETKTSAFTVETGASIRYSEPTGIRFKVKLGQTEYESLVDTTGETLTYKDGKTLYATIAPMKIINGMTYDADSLGALNGKGEIKVDVSTIRQGNVEEDEDANYYYANVVLGNVLYENLSREFAAIAYTKDGETVSLMDTKPVEGRSVAYVASAALADTSITLNDTQKNLLNEYVQLALAYEDGTTEENAKTNYENATLLSVTPELSKETATVKIGKTIALTKTIDTEVKLFGAWTSSNPAIATVDENGVVTGVSAGEATISYSVYGKSASCVVTVKDIQRGLTEDFSQGYLEGNTYYGAWDIAAASEHNISLTENGELYLTTTSKNYNVASVWTTFTISGLTPGKVYNFSYDAKVNKDGVEGTNRHYGESWRIYKDEDNNLTDATGTAALFAELYVPMVKGDGTTWVAFNDNTRYNWNHYFGLFVAGNETVVIKLATTDTSATYYDNFKMEEVSKDDGKIEIGDTDEITVGEQVKFNPTIGDSLLFRSEKNFTWETNESSVVTLESSTDVTKQRPNYVTVTAVKAGTATITLKFKDIEIATKTITVKEDTEVQKDVEDFENGYFGKQGSDTVNRNYYRTLDETVNKFLRMPSSGVTMSLVDVDGNKCLQINSTVSSQYIETHWYGLKVNSAYKLSVKVKEVTANSYLNKWRPFKNTAGTNALGCSSAMTETATFLSKGSEENDWVTYSGLFIAGDSADVRIDIVLNDGMNAYFDDFMLEEIKDTSRVENFEKGHIGTGATGDSYDTTRNYYSEGVTTDSKDNFFLRKQNSMTMSLVDVDGDKCLQIITPANGGYLEMHWYNLKVNVTYQISIKVKNVNEASDQFTNKFSVFSTFGDATKNRQEWSLTKGETDANGWTTYTGTFTPGTSKDVRIDFDCSSAFKAYFDDFVLTEVK